MASIESEEPRIERAIDGDGEALEELLRECGPRVAAGLSIDPRWRPSLETEEVMQVTYLEAYLRIFTLQARTMAGFRGWLARIAENNLRDAVRALQRDKRPDAYGRAVRAGGTSAETLATCIKRAGLDPVHVTSGFALIGPLSKVYRNPAMLSAACKRTLQPASKSSAVALSVSL